VTERLYRHPTDRSIAGVAGGLAVWLDIDPSLVRIAWVLLAIFSGGIFVLVYLVMMIVVPLPPAGWVPRPRASVPGQGWQPGTARWGPPTDPSAWGAPTDPSGAWGPAVPPAPDWGTPPMAPPPGFVPGAPGAPGSPSAPGGPGAPATSGRPPQDASTTPASSPAPAWNPPRTGNAGIVAGVVLIGLGVWFLVDQFIDVNWDLLWPVAIMVLGGALIAGALMRGRTS
jgi:phage shock protein PspC (stress-responsive transcriptional regulator)